MVAWYNFAMKWTPFALSILLSLFLVLATSMRDSAAEALVVRHDLRLRLIPETNALEATDDIFVNRTPETLLTLRLSPVTTIVRLSLNGVEPPYSINHGYLEIHPQPNNIDTETHLSISYQSRFRDQVPLDPVNNEDPTYGISGTISPEGVFLSGENGWYPRITSERMALFRVRIEAPPAMTAVTSGKLIDKGTTPSLSYSTWETAHPLSTLTLVAGNYEIAEKSQDRIKLYTYFYPQNRSLSGTYLEAVDGYMSLYQGLFGPYPFSKFAVVENFFPTGYGFPSWTLLGSTVVQLPFIVKTSLGHEIAHSWWGNGVEVDLSEGNWSEGLTTYVADHLFQERISPQEGQNYRIKILRDYATLVNSSNDIPLTEFIYRNSKATQAIGYGKGAMVFHMLRKTVGENIFWKGLRDLAQSKMYHSASWSDFQHLFSTLSGKNLNTFFTQWLTRAGAPEIGMTDISARPHKDGWLISGNLTQKGKPYAMDIPVRIKTSKMDIQRVISTHSASTRFEFSVEAPPVSLELDPDTDIFRRLAPEEIPPAINAIRGSTSLLVILSSHRTTVYDAALGRLLEGLGQPKARILREDEVSAEMLKGHDILYAGSPQDNHFMSAFPAGFTPGDQSFSIRGELYNKPDDAMFAVFSHPSDKNRVFSVFMANSPEAALTVAGKIPHYGKYSYIAFTSGKNADKGTWPVTDSPMLHDFTTGQRTHD